MEDPLTEIACKEQPISTACTQRGQEPQFRHPDILRLIDDDEIEWRFAPGYVRRDATEQIGPCDGLAFAETGPHSLENRPKNLALLTADAGFATESGDIPVILPGRQLPSVYDLAPLAGQEPR